jgi:protein-S-isoprenylcysteine O-methyltransferase
VSRWFRPRDRPTRFRIVDFRDAMDNHLMGLPNPAMLGAIYGVSEIVLAITRRAKAGTVSHDRSSIRLLWGVILVCLGLSFAAVWFFPAGRFPNPELCYAIGLALFIAGLVLRWYAIIYLGRFFTVDVAIAEEHELIDSGPYRFIRHPSYTGALLAFVGFGLCLGNWLSFFCIIPIAGAFAWRIRVEERALLGALGEEYHAYTQRTKRLIPFVY